MSPKPPPQPSNQARRRPVTHPGATLTLTPWQECVEIIHDLGRRYDRKASHQQRKKCAQEGEVEFLETSGEYINGGTVADKPLFDDLGDKTEPTNTPFCILDDDDDFGLVPETPTGQPTQLAK